MTERKFQGRAFTSLLSLVSFLILGSTGIMLYIVPQGRIAYWVDWELLGLTKTQWGDIHVLAGCLFLISGIFHIYFNWKPMINYLSGKAKGAFRYKRELALSGLVFAWIVVSGIGNLPPLIYILDLGANIKDGWIISAEHEPPMGHAEQLALSSLTKKMGIPLDKAMAEMRAKGVKVNSPNESLGQIAKQSGLSPMETYATIKHLEPAPQQMAPGQKWTTELIEETFSGKGLGSKKLSQVVGQVGLNLEKTIGRLKKAGISAGGEEVFKDIAAKAEKTPMDVLKIALEGEPATPASGPQAAPAAAPAAPAKPWLTAEQIEAKFEGKGVGRKKISEVLTQAGHDPDQALARLAQKGIEAGPHDLVKDIANKVGKAPMDILKLALLD